MTLTSIIADVERKRKTITVFSPEEPVGLASWFDGRHVTVKHEHIPDASEGFIVVSRGGEYLGSTDLEALQWLTHPPVEEPWARNRARDEFQHLLELLNDTVFSSLDRRQMLAAAREIEDRAWRVGIGTLRTGFQTLDAFKAQVRVYSRLASRRRLRIYVYGAPDWNPPRIPRITYVATVDPDIRRTWFVVYDGGGRAVSECALLAREQPSGEFWGFWTYDPAIVDRIISAVNAAAR